MADHCVGRAELLLGLAARQRRPTRKWVQEAAGPEAGVPRFYWNCK